MSKARLNMQVAEFEMRHIRHNLSHATISLLGGVKGDFKTLSESEVYAIESELIDLLGKATKLADKLARDYTEAKVDF